MSLENLAFDAPDNKPIRAEVEASLLEKAKLYDEPETMPSKRSKPKKHRATGAIPPPLVKAPLSPAEQLEQIEKRRAELDAGKNTKHLNVALPLHVYGRLVSMAESEHITGSFRHSFAYFVGWCLFVGLKYYEAYGLTHTNPDKINFSNPSGRRDSFHPTPYNEAETSAAYPEDDYTSAVQREVQDSFIETSASIHPQLGRQRYRYPEREPEMAVPGGNEMSPDFDREAAADAVRALLPASTR